MLAARDFNRLKRVLGVDEDELREIRALILSLDPKPGRQYGIGDIRYVVPDVVVRRVAGRWIASLNRDAMPRLRINKMYADILQASRDNGAKHLAGQLQEARWLIKNVQQRFDTILRVTQAIVDRQKNFFEHGEVAMRPLVLREIAEAVGLHESTISRVTTQKYMLTRARHLRAEVLLRQPCLHRHRRGVLRHRDPRAHQAAGGRRGRQEAALRPPHLRHPRPAGHPGRPAHRSQVREAMHIQPANLRKSI